MKLKQKILAGVSALALGSAIFTGTASAFTGTVTTGGSFTSNAQAQVTNTLTVTTSPLAFGTFAALGDGTNVVTATLSATGTFTGSSNVGSKIIDAKQGDHSASSISVTGFPGVTLYSNYGNVHDLAGVSGDIFQVVYVADNLATVGGRNVTANGTGGVADTCEALGGGTAPTHSATGSGTTNAGTGILTFGIGAKIQTVAATKVYHSEAYTGTFDLTLSY
jgi:hypothetical protein